MEREPHDEEPHIRNPGESQAFRLTFGAGVEQTPDHVPTHSGFIIADDLTRTAQGFVTDEGIWLTLTNAAKILNYHTTTLERLARTGRIAALRLDRIWLINVDKFSSYLADKARPGRPNGQNP